MAITQIVSIFDLFQTSEVLLGHSDIVGQKLWEMPIAIAAQQNAVMHEMAQWAFSWRVWSLTYCKRPYNQHRFWWIITQLASYPHWSMIAGSLPQKLVPYQQGHLTWSYGIWIIAPGIISATFVARNSSFDPVHSCIVAMMILTRLLDAHLQRALWCPFLHSWCDSSLMSGIH